MGSKVSLTDEEFEASEPSDTRTTSSYSSASSDSTTPLSPDHPLTQTIPTQASFHHRTISIIVRAQPTMSPGYSARVAEAMTLSNLAFRKRYRSFYETPSPSPSLNLSVQKRYIGISKLILDTDSEGDELGDEDTEEDREDESSYTDDERERSEDEGPGLKGREEEAVPEAVREDQVPNTFEVGQISRSMPEQQGAERISAFRHPTWVDPTDGTVYTDIPVYVPPVAPIQTLPSLEWSFGSLPVSPSSLVVPSPVALPVTTLVATIMVDDDQFLEHAIYDIHKENHDLRMQIAEERHERLELADRVARMERRHESREE
ncbi:hypothetical protein Tco_1267883 [Tanacetum coccineum]